MEQFQPNANNILDVLYNKKPKYLPLYEHHIDIEFIEKFTGEELIGYRETEPEYFFKKVTEFWKNNTYDAFDFEPPTCRTHISVTVMHVPKCTLRSALRVWHFRICPRFGRLRESVYHAIHRSRLVPRPFYSYR